MGIVSTIFIKSATAAAATAGQFLMSQLKVTQNKVKSWLSRKNEIQKKDRKFLKAEKNQLKLRRR